MHVRAPITLLGVTVAAGAAAAAHAVAETRRFELREVSVPLLPNGHEPLRVLHLSDLHLTPGQHRKQEWVSTLAALAPDLVVNTGDNLAHRDSLPAVLEALGGLLDVPGVFVLGSNDYYSPVLRNPLRYLLPDDGSRNTTSEQLAWREMKAAYVEAGWMDLDNTRASFTVGRTSFAFAGVDDPHLEYDRLEDVAGPADPTADVRLGVAHAPYLRVLDQFAHDGYDAVLAGHTHGGQVCLPGGRALVTNCDLEPARVKGLHRHPADSRPDEPGSSWLHVSGGLGTSPYAQVRLFCRPEATLLTLTPRD
jgi:predicted MPP superfamily phosphohydrolase